MAVETRKESRRSALTESKKHSRVWNIGHILTGAERREWMAMGEWDY